MLSVALPEPTAQGRPMHLRLEFGDGIVSQCVLRAHRGIFLDAFGVDEKNHKLRKEFEDGSRLKGTTLIEKLSLRTSYAQMEIPLRLIGEVTFNRDDASVTVHMQNGDNLKGVLNLSSFKLSTSFGAVSAPIEKLTRISIAKGEEASPGK